MAITWDVRTEEIVNAETDLRKIVATRTDNVKGVIQSFRVKGLMKSNEDQKKMWDEIWAQYEVARVVADTVDTVAVSGKVNLEAREVE